MFSHTIKSAIFIILAVILPWITTGNCNVLSAISTNEPLNSGTLIWAKALAGDKTCRAEGIARLSDDSIVVTGYFSGRITLGVNEANETVLESAGAYDIFLARYRSDGSLIWAKRAGGKSKDASSAITVLSDDSIVITGYSWHSAVFGEGDPNRISLHADKSFQLTKSTRFLARYDSNGTLLWAKEEGGVPNSTCKAMTSLFGDSFVIAGWFTETTTFAKGAPNETILTSAGGTDIFLAKYNSDGDLIWVKQAGGPQKSDYSHGISSQPDNSVVLIGHYSGDALFGDGSPNKTVLESDEKGDCFIARYDPDGSLRWVKSAGLNGSDGGRAIAGLSDNSFVVSGYFSNIAVFGEGQSNRTQIKSAGDQDIFIACYDPEGTFKWVESAGSYFRDDICGITSLSDDSTVITGTYLNSIVFGAGEYNQTDFKSKGLCDIFFARYGANGSLIWAKSAGGAEGLKNLFNESGMGIVSLSDDSVVVIGNFTRSATFGEYESNMTNLSTDGDVATFIARFAP